MQIGDIRYLFGYDRWATRRILAACAGLGGNTWAAPNAIGERGLGGILIHQLGAHQRWRHGLSDSSESPRLEKGPLPSIEALTESWEQEWRDLDAWLARVDDAFLARTDELGVPFWQMLAHVVNHGTQHRAEAAALLTDAGHSPGDLDMIDFAEELARGTA
jgi:uncharacterized damage-inducible protein DinB